MHSKILRSAGAMLALCAMIGTTGCWATKHVAIPTGSTGQILRRGTVVKAAFPNASGALEVGEYEVQAGDLIRRPKTEAEVIETLKASGAKFEE
jgi:hypothetical protein